MDELLTRGVDKVYPTADELQALLKSGKKIRVYQGFDPTGPQLHIGHLVGLRKLRQWQDAGHKVIFLIGDFTAMVGDPSGKTTARKVLSHEETLENAKAYQEQAGRILDFGGPNPVEIKHNGDWLGKMSAIDFFKLSSNLTFNQIIERDLFQERQKKGEEIYGNELLYPFMQAYDSVELEVDLEIGGTDQTFNMLMGRKLLRNIKKKDKFVMTTPLLTDSSGNKIGKTEGNIIALTDEPAQLYRKIMALGDDVIVKGLEYLTDTPMNEIREIENQINQGENPMQFKKRLAYEVTKQLNTEKDAKSAQEEFEKTVQKGELPSQMEEIDVHADQPIDEDLLVNLGFASSKSEAKRLFEQNGVALDGVKIKAGEALADEAGEGLVLSVGKRMVKLRVNG